VCVVSHTVGSGCHRNITGMSSATPAREARAWERRPCDAVVMLLWILAIMSAGSTRCCIGIVRVRPPRGGPVWISVTRVDDKQELPVVTTASVDEACAALRSWLTACVIKTAETKERGA
jgi:hypothetical protein